jgi:hypothetical protein
MCVRGAASQQWAVGAARGLRKFVETTRKPDATTQEARLLTFDGTLIDNMSFDTSRPKTQQQLDLYQPSAVNLTISRMKS